MPVWSCYARCRGTRASYMEEPPGGRVLSPVAARGFTSCEAEFHAIESMGPISRRPAARDLRRPAARRGWRPAAVRGLLLLSLILLVLAAAATAPAGAAVRLGPDLSVKPCVGQQACFAAVGCQAAQYS